MIIAHLADLHLGYRAYNRQTAAGMNVREADVAAAFAEAVEAIVREQPQLVLVAGDVFHSVRPSNAAIAEAFRGFASLRARLPDTPVVMLAGDRDTPRSIETAAILPLFREIPGITVVTEQAERVALPALGATVLALPHAALARRGAGPIEPLPTGSGTRILMLHGTVTGPRAGRLLEGPAEAGGVSIPEGSIDAAAWDYVALGHHPVATELAPNVHYPGGIERTSGDVWTEAERDKGFLLFDSERGAARLHPLALRTVLDLPRLDAGELSALELDGAIEQAVAGIPGGLEGKVVRLVIVNLDRRRMRELDQRRLRGYRAEALHFVVDAHPPASGLSGALARSTRGQSLEQQIEEYLSAHWEPTMGGIERGRVVALAREYLGRATESGEP